MVEVRGSHGETEGLASGQRGRGRGGALGRTQVTGVQEDVGLVHRGAADRHIEAAARVEVSHHHPVGAAEAVPMGPLERGARHIGQLGAAREGVGVHDVDASAHLYAAARGAGHPDQQVVLAVPVQVATGEGASGVVQRAGALEGAERIAAADFAADVGAVVDPHRARVAPTRRLVGVADHEVRQPVGVDVEVGEAALGGVGGVVPLVRQRDGVAVVEAAAQASTAFEHHCPVAPVVGVGAAEGHDIGGAVAGHVRGACPYHPGRSAEVAARAPRDLGGGDVADVGVVHESVAIVVGAVPQLGGVAVHGGVGVVAVPVGLAHAVAVLVHGGALGVEVTGGGVVGGGDRGGGAAPPLRTPRIAGHVVVRVELVAHAAVGRPPRHPADLAPFEHEAESVGGGEREGRRIVGELHGDAAVHAHIEVVADHEAAAARHGEVPVEGDGLPSGVLEHPAVDVERARAGVLELEPLADRVVHRAGGGHHLHDEELAEEHEVLVGQPVVVLVFLVERLDRAWVDLRGDVVAVGAAVGEGGPSVAVLVVVVGAVTILVHAVVPDFVRPRMHVRVGVVAVVAARRDVPEAVVVGVGGHEPLERHEALRRPGVVARQRDHAEVGSGVDGGEDHGEGERVARRKHLGGGGLVGEGGVGCAARHAQRIGTGGAGVAHHEGPRLGLPGLEVRPAQQERGDLDACAGRRTAAAAVVVRLRVATVKHKGEQEVNEAHLSVHSAESVAATGAVPRAIRRAILPSAPPWAGEGRGRCRTRAS